MPVIPQQTVGWNFLGITGVTLTNFSSVDDIVYTSDPVPYKHRGIIRDFGIIFQTAGGSVYISKVFASGSEMRITGSISATATGLGAIVLSQGQKLRIRIASAGSGVIHAYDDGVLEDEIPSSAQFDGNRITANLERRGGF